MIFGVSHKSIEASRSIGKKHGSMATGGLSNRTIFPVSYFHPQLVLPLQRIRYGGHLASRVSLGNYYHVLSAVTAANYNPRDFDKIDRMSSTFTNSSRILRDL